MSFAPRQIHRMARLLLPAALGLVLGGAILASALPARAGTGPDPRAVVERLHAALSAAMKEGPALGFAGRVAALTPVVRDAFAFPTMTRIATGVQWGQIAPDQQAALIEAFSRYSIASYAANFARSEGERFETKGERPAAGGGIIVETRLVLSPSNAVNLHYLMRSGGEGGGEAWKINDVYLSGTISELAGRRSEFASLLRLGGPAGLLAGLEQKVADLARPPSSAASAPAPSGK